MADSYAGVMPMKFNLYLSEPDGQMWCTAENEKERRQLHGKVARLISNIMKTKEVAKEAVLWMADFLGEFLLHQLSEQEFVDLFTPKFGKNSGFTSDILLLLCQYAPGPVARILFPHSMMWRCFFGYYEILNKLPSADEPKTQQEEEEEEDSDENKSIHVKSLSPLSIDRIKRWFAHMTAAGEAMLGSRALKWYFLANRDTVWHLTSWTGKRAIMPPVAVKQAQSFLQMDFVATTANLLMYPPFWESTEWRECIWSGEILSLDYQYFTDYLLQEVQSGRLVSELRLLFAEHVKKDKVSFWLRSLFLSSNSEDILLFFRQSLQLLEKKQNSSALRSHENIMTLLDPHQSDFALLRHFCSSFDELSGLIAMTRKVSFLIKMMESETGEDKKSLFSMVQVSDDRSDNWEKDRHQHWSLRLATRKESEKSKIHFMFFESFLIRIRFTLMFFNFDLESKKERSVMEHIFRQENATFRSVKEKHKRKRHGSRPWVGWTFDLLSGVKLGSLDEEKGKKEVQGKSGQKEEEDKQRGKREGETIRFVSVYSRVNLGEGLCLLFQKSLLEWMDRFG